MSKKQFLDVDCSRGAPMGRAPYGIAADCPARSIRLFRVRLDAGGYDDGGAYWGRANAVSSAVWGSSGPLYCARYGDTYRAFTRATSRKDAAERLRIVSGMLRVRV
jgi:hypothetical protein